ncbi:hypothetical protein ABK040_007128 [Willaertia magna]
MLRIVNKLSHHSCFRKKNFHTSLFKRDDSDSMADGLYLKSWFSFWLGRRLAPYVPTPMKGVEDMLKLADVNENDIIYDLGCGDGRVLIKGIKDFNAKKGIGFELDKEIYKKAIDNITKNNLQEKIEILLQDALKGNLSEANVVMIYLSDGGNMKLFNKFKEELQPNARIISYCFPFDEQVVKPNERILTCGNVPVYLYIKNKDGSIGLTQ